MHFDSEAKRTAPFPSTTDLFTFLALGRQRLEWPWYRAVVLHAFGFTQAHVAATVDESHGQIGMILFRSPNAAVPQLLQLLAENGHGYTAAGPETVMRRFRQLSSSMWTTVDRDLKKVFLREAQECETRPFNTPEQIKAIPLPMLKVCTKDWPAGVRRTPNGYASLYDLMRLGGYENPNFKWQYVKRYHPHLKPLVGKYALPSVNGGRQPSPVVDDTAWLQVSAVLVKQFGSPLVVSTEPEVLSSLLVKVGVQPRHWRSFRRKHPEHMSLVTQQERGNRMVDVVQPSDWPALAKILKDFREKNIRKYETAWSPPSLEVDDELMEPDAPVAPPAPARTAPNMTVIWNALREKMTSHWSDLMSGRRPALVMADGFVFALRDAGVLTVYTNEALIPPDEKKQLLIFRDV